MTNDIQEQLKNKYEELQRVNGELAALLEQDGKLDEVQDYTLTDCEGSEVKLSELFDEHEQMVLVHNMGFACMYCSLWADGFNGIWKHLESGAYGNKARFVLISEDSPGQQAAGKAQRGWTFDMYSAAGTSFSTDLDFKTEHEGKQYLQPGASILFKDADGKISRHAKTFGQIHTSRESS